MHLPFVNLGAKSQPNSFDGHRFGTLCLQDTLARISLILQNLVLSSTCHRWNQIDSPSPSESCSNEKIYRDVSLEAKVSSF